MNGAGSSLLLLGALLIAAAPTAPPSATVVTVYRPWSSDTLRHGFTVEHSLTGSCWTQSLTVDRPDAWRCAVQNDLWDPCFAPAPKPRVLACADSPFNKRVMLLTLKKPLPADHDPTTDWLQPKGEPWGLRLTDGDTCDFQAGATDAVNGERMNYECTGKGWIVGFPDRSKSIWIAKKILWPNKSRIIRVGIATAVF